MIGRVTKNHGFSSCVYQLEIPTGIAVVIGIYTLGERAAKFGTRPKLLVKLGAYLTTVETGGELGGGVDFVCCLSPRQAPRDVS